MKLIIQLIMISISLTVFLSTMAYAGTALCAADGGTNKVKCVFMLDKLNAKDYADFYCKVDLKSGDQSLFILQNNNSLVSGFNGQLRVMTGEQVNKVFFRAHIDPNTRESGTPWMTIGSPTNLTCFSGTGGRMLDLGQG